MPEPSRPVLASATSRGLRMGWGRPAAAVAVSAALLLSGCGSVLQQPADVPASALQPASSLEPAAVEDHPAVVTGSPAGVETDRAPDEEVISELSGLTPLDTADLAALAARMDEALREGTEEDWLALFDGEEEDLAEQQRRWFRSVHAVPMDVREILPGGVLAADTEEGSVVQLVLAHQITGADPVPAMETYRATVRRPPGEEPRISQMSGQNRADGHPQLWDLHPVHVTVTDQLVALAPQGREGDVAAVLPGLVSATHNIFVDFDTGRRERLVVQLVDADDLRSIADDEDLAIEPAGVAMNLPGLGQRPPPGEVGVRAGDEHADRIVMDLDLLVQGLEHGNPPGGWGLMRHEAVHAVVDGNPDVTPPVWVWEGLAEWYGFRRDYVVDEAYRRVVATAGGRPLQLPDSLDAYYYESQEAGEVAYAASAMVFAYLEARFGFETARDVGVGLTQVDTWYDTDDADALLLDLIGMTLEQLEQEWTVWAVGTYG